MFERAIAIILGILIFYLLRFKILKKPLSPMRSGIIGVVIVLAGIHLHYAFLPYETFQGGVTYTSLGVLAFLMLQYGSQRKDASKGRGDGEK